MATVQIKLPRLHEHQRAIYEHPARFKVVACGRRFGKTEMAKARLIRGAIYGKPVAYFSPTYKLLLQTWRELTHALKPVTRAVNNSDHRVDLVTGGVIEAWSLDTENVAVGRKYADVVIDEAARVRHSEVWSEAIRPTLTDLKGTALFISTPRGHNWFWRLYQLGIDPLQAEWQSWTFPTSANPYIDAAEIESARQVLPARIFAQEYLAEFTQDGGGVFAGVHEASTLEAGQPDDGGVYVFGVDWGRHNDFTAISVIDVTKRRQVWLERFTGTAYEVQRARIISLYQRWRPAAIYAEANSMGEPNIEALVRAGLPVYGFTTTAQSKPPLIEGLALAIERGELLLLNDAVQVAEMTAYEMERLPSGRYTYSAPDGQHDDTVIALALAWHGVCQYGPALLFAM